MNEDWRAKSRIKKMLQIATTNREREGGEADFEDRKGFILSSKMILNDRAGDWGS